MNQQETSNVYLEQVIEQQAKVDLELKRKRAPSPAASRGGMPGEKPPGLFRPKNDEKEITGHGVDYRITGFGPWRTVVIPPNVYAIHTRRGHDKPIHSGLGSSFHFRPHTDAFLIIPAAVQTLLINANCICIERQGILVQAYVQWIIDDINVAYRKLDFSDSSDPMNIVNVQLREQAEAAIKDKVSTMSVDEVLSDKQPIIEELTHRLRKVAEGSREGDHASGLGLKIVTIQIKEAVVSSSRLWQNLQIPFRAEREKLARLAQLESQEQLAARELANRIARETAELEATSRLAQLRAEKEQEQYDLEHTEKVRRNKLKENGQREAIGEHNKTAKLHSEAELELVLQKIMLEKQRATAEIEQAQLQMQLDDVLAQQTFASVAAELQNEEIRDSAKDTRVQRELQQFKTRHDIENLLSDAYIRAQLIAKLPEIAENLPAPDQQHTTIISSDPQEDVTFSSLLRFLAGALGLSEGILKPPHDKENEA